jgi:zinc transporter ZupT
MIVFLAIMLHKAPAAFGLVTFLLHEGLDRNRAKKHLLIFSVSAPTMALVTFIVLESSGGSGGPMEGKVCIIVLRPETMSLYDFVFF